MSKKTTQKSKVKSQKSKASKKAKPARKAAKKTSGKAAKKATKTTKAKTTKARTAKPVKAVRKAQPPVVTAIIDGLEEKKAKNITLLDLTHINGRSFDYFVIADADSGTHVESIAGSVEEVVKKQTGERPYHTEGWQNAEWILLDYIDVIVHVFQRPVREFYNLEGLWADADVQKIN